MAQIVLGIATSHTPMLALSADLWGSYAQRDAENPELAFPPDGLVMPYREALDAVPPEVRAKYRGAEPYAAQAAQCQRALDALAGTLRACRPDVTVVITDDQDEWFFEDNMPALAVYWGETAPLRPRYMPPGVRDRAVAEAITRGYGDVAMDVPVASAFGRYLIEYLIEHDFDVAHVRDGKPLYGGRVARRYPTKNGELQYVRETPPREQGLPHGVSFVVKRLFDNRPGAILPVFQNTCYPPNQPTPRRSFAMGEAMAAAVRAWSEPATVAIVASGGLSHFVVDEELDRAVLGALERNDPAALTSIPRHRLHSAASEALNWIALGGAMHATSLTMELLAYVPVYRTPAATGGGWAFARWR
jgi:catalytic LigB subunit of aromatic ring-opening dioxygenase